MTTATGKGAGRSTRRDVLRGSSLALGGLAVGGGLLRSGRAPPRDGRTCTSAPFPYALCDELGQRQHGPSVAPRAVRGQPVVMLKQAREDAELDHRIGIC